MPRQRKFATAFDVTTPGASQQWAIPSNLGATDGAFSTCSVGSGFNSRFIRSSGFGFTLPSVAVITRVTCYAWLKTATGNTNLLNARLYDVPTADWAAGNDISSDVGATGLPTTLTEKEYTPATGDTLWGLTITPASANDAAFGVQLRFSGSAAIEIVSVDSIELELDYDYNVPTFYFSKMPGSQPGTLPPFSGV